MRTLVYGLAAAGIAIGAASAAAQSTTPAAQNQPASQSDAMLTPSGFVETAGNAGLFEIESSRLALQKAKNPEVKAFAEMMIRDHTRIAKELTATVAKAGLDITVPAKPDAGAQAMLDRLAAASDSEFDALYVEMQTKGHEEAVALFTNYSKSGDQPALKAFAVATLPTLQRHLDHVRMIKLGA